jgi:hypothetical protein
MVALRRSRRRQEREAMAALWAAKKAGHTRDQLRDLARRVKDAQDKVHDACRAPVLVFQKR